MSTGHVDHTTRKEKRRWRQCVRCGIDTSVSPRQRACVDCRESDGEYVAKALGR